MKLFAIILILTLISSSCEIDKSLKYKKVAKQICECMQKAEKTPVTEEAMKDVLKIDQKKLDYSLCTSNIGDVDFKDTAMLKAINNNCPELKKIHINYLEQSK